MEQNTLIWRWSLHIVEINCVMATLQLILKVSICSDMLDFLTQVCSFYLFVGFHPANWAQTEDISMKIKQPTFMYILNWAVASTRAHARMWKLSDWISERLLSRCLFLLLLVFRWGWQRSVLRGESIRSNQYTTVWLHTVTSLKTADFDGFPETGVSLSHHPESGIVLFLLLEHISDSSAWTISGSCTRCFLPTDIKRTPRTRNLSVFLMTRNCSCSPAFPSNVTRVLRSQRHARLLHV